MEDNYLEIFKKIQKIKNSYSVYENADENLVQEFLNSKVDKERVDTAYDDIYNYYDTSVSDKEAKEFLDKFKKDFNQERFDKLITDCKNEVIKSIITPFGLGKIVAAYDKVGGNVTTIHNANNKEFIDFDNTKYKGGIYANEEDKYDREKYTNKKNSEGKQFAGDSKKSVGNEFTKSRMDNDKNVIDAYTGNIQKADTTSPDHIKSLSQYHKDGGFMQSTVQKADFATDENNLALTDRSINQSMRDYDKNEWKNKETEKGIKNKDKFKIDEERLSEEIIKGEQTANKHLPTNLEKTQYYLSNSARTGINEAGKMGIQQALGLVIVEFFTAVFDEIIDIYKNGFASNFEDERFLNILKERLLRIGNKIKDKWKDVAIAFKDGVITGFISNLVTTFINVFLTTGKRLVRIIREGFFSLFKAVKILLFPPEGLTYEEALHEAKKILATGVIVGLGVIVEQYIDGLIKATIFLEPFADILTSIFIGSLTGLAVAMAVYHIDKKKNDKDAVKLLMQNTDKTYEEINKLLTFQHLN